MLRRPARLLPAALLLAPLLPGGALSAQDDDERAPGWYDTAEFSLVLTAGNTESSAFGLKNELERQFTNGKLSFRLGGIRVETGDVERTAVGTAEDFEVIEESDREPTAENYYASLRYDRDISERTFAYGSAGWERDRFAGIRNRWVGAAGIGRKLVDNARTTFQADLGVTVTSEEPLTGDTETFGGLRFTWDLDHQLTETAEFTSDLVVDENLSDTEDLRAVFDNAIAVDISEALALKAGLKLNWDNLPALEEVPLLDAPGGTQVGTVVTPLEELDTQLTVALVVTL